MEHKGRLEWVERNRRRPERYQKIGALVEGLMEGLEDNVAARMLAGALADVVDDQARQCCRVARLRGSMLEIHVNHPSLVRPMLMRWYAPMLESARRTPVKPKVTKLAFTYGTAGMAIPTCNGNLT